MPQRYAYFQHVDSSDNEQEVENNEMEVAEEALVYYQHKLYHPDDVLREESPTYTGPVDEVIIKGVKEKRPVFLNWL